MWKFVSLNTNVEKKKDLMSLTMAFILKNHNKRKKIKMKEKLITMKETMK